MPRLARYGPGARIYDIVSGERLVYRVGRIAGIDALRLSPGDIVLDLGCGTGLNLPYLLEKVGAAGLVIGVDRSAAMLRVARDKVERNGWRNVQLIEADAADLSWPDLAAVLSADGREPTISAAIATYAMSVFDDWHPAWDLMRAALRPGGRISIVDMALPVGFGAIFSPLARLACAVGGADLDAAPWRELEATGSDVSHSTHRSGHIHVVAGSFP